MASTSNPKPTAVVLTIAGSDCSGGAGLQADIKTAAAFGVFAASAVTAITAQNSAQLYNVFVLPAQQVQAQLDAVRNGLSLSAVKLGMLGNSTIAEVVAEFLRELRAAQPSLPIVIDPVIKASSGGNLSCEGILAVYREQLLPLASLLTPNIPEAANLLNTPEACSLEDMEQQARALCAAGAPAVLLKGGHFVGGTSHAQQLATDILACAQGIFPFSSPRLATTHSHGGGCSLATALAAGLAQGLQLRQAVAAAKTFMQGALTQSARLQLAPINGPLHHFYNFW